MIGEAERIRRMRIFFCSLVFCLWIANALAVDIELSIENPDILLNSDGEKINILDLLESIIVIESGENDSHINIREGAIGCLQIRECVLHDVREKCNLHVEPDMRYDRVASMKIAIAYLLYWGNKYEKKNKESMTAQVLCRIWNGGPTGYRKSSTLSYWEKVRQQLEYSLE